MRAICAKVVIGFVAAAVGVACQQTKPVAGEHGAEDGWRRTFNVDKANLEPGSWNPYFKLDPGQVRVYKGGSTVLTITVLNETRVVDGVTTRVIEEREEEGGALKEVSRNFFATDKTTWDVYYFGEEVDLYKDGKIVGHGGAWRSGVNGAKFGLMMPGKPVAGDRFYQELAPGVAMDRAEIVSVSEQLATAAGKFGSCVHVRETTPLEKDVGEKWYALGMGLVKDDEVESVARPDTKR